MRQTGSVAERSDSAYVEVTGEHEVYTVMHEQITQLIRFLKTAGRLDGSQAVKMLQNLPVRHRDDHVALGLCGFSLRFNPS